MNGTDKYDIKKDEWGKVFNLKGGLRRKKDWELIKIRGKKNHFQLFNESCYRNIRNKTILNQSECK